MPPVPWYRPTGKRRVILAGTVIAEIEGHLDTYTAAGADARLLTSRRGQLLRQSKFRRTTWTEVSRSRHLRPLGHAHPSERRS